VKSVTPRQASNSAAGRITRQLNRREDGKMKRNHLIWKLLAVVLIFGLLSVAGAMAAEETLTGMVENGDQGIVLSADDGETYMVQGQDLSDMVGKSVKATGTLAEGSSGKTITVTKVEEIKE
jgi:hypothetical protein